jgi:hypothetical protein
MNAFGGFLRLEPVSSGTGPYHAVPAFNTGRACLRVILEMLRPRRVHVPFYVCDAVLSPLRAVGVECVFYALDDTLAPVSLPAEVPEHDLYLAVNYFGVLSQATRAISVLSPTRVVIDNAHAFFRREATTTWSFNSARKFFGVPDGAYLCGPLSGIERNLPPFEPETDYLLLETSDRALEQFRRHEAMFDDEPRAISDFAASVMNRIDYARVAARRRANFLALDERLGDVNRLRLMLSPDDVPLYYPFLAPIVLRDELIRRRVFVPLLWPEILTRSGGSFAWERELAARLCPLPVDQRYDAEAMREVAVRVRGVLPS